MPVGCDHDGAVANAYAVAVCPTITFARAGGKVVADTLGCQAAAGEAALEPRDGRATPRCATRRSPPELAAEFPGLRLARAHARGAPGPSPPELRERLRVLSDRFRGAQAIALRRQPIPHAYRVFFRHIGLDPDEHRTPVEALALERLQRGGFRLALGARRRAHDRGDGDRRAGVGARRRRGSRASSGCARAAARRARSAAARRARRCPRAGWCVADDAGPVAVLFGALAPGRGVGRRTTRITLLALQVAGVPDIHVEEALWTVADAIG